MLRAIAMQRRTFLATAVVASLAGCAGSDEPTDQTSGENENENGGGELEIVEHSFYSDGMMAGVEGLIVNNTDNAIDYVEAKAVFYNEDEQRVGDSIANTTDLAAGEEWAFNIPALGDPDEIDSYELSVSDSPF